MECTLYGGGVHGSTLALVDSKLLLVFLCPADANSKPSAPQGGLREAGYAGFSALLQLWDDTAARPTPVERLSRPLGVNEPPDRLARGSNFQNFTLKLGM